MWLLRDLKDEQATRCAPLSVRANLLLSSFLNHAYRLRNQSCTILAVSMSAESEQSGQPHHLDTDTPEGATGE